MKVFAIRTRLDMRVAYAVNEDKMTLADGIDYATDAEKTGHVAFRSTLNCGSVQTAFSEMQRTKEKWHKTDGVLGYHFIQAFAPGEVTPQQAHEIGMEFARRCFGTRFEVVIGTHLDRQHLHNHLVVNSVSFTDGAKYHSSPESYYKEIRGTSDALCSENGLSVIQPAGKGKHYAEWRAEQQGAPTVRGQIRADVDEILRSALTYKSFWELMRRSGYEIKAGENRKYVAVRPPGSPRFIRLRSLGAGYSEDEIAARIMAQRSVGTTAPPRPPQLTQQKRRMRYRSKLPARKKITGFRALYFRYLYLLGSVKKRRAPRRVSGYLRDDIARFERYVEQYRFLQRYRVGTCVELSVLTDALDAQIDALADERRKLSGIPARENNRAQLTDHLRSLRGQRRMCERITASAEKIKARLAHMQAEKQVAQPTRKEREQYESRKRRR